MNYFLSPRSGERSYRNFESTIKHGVPFSKIETNLQDEGKRLLLQEKVIYAWGNREGTRSAWERMQLGDLVIFYAHKKLVMTGEVYYKEHNPQLALTMWPPDEHGNPWEYTFFLKNLNYISIPIEEFNKVVGYKPNNIIQGFTYLNQDRVQRIVAAYGSVERYLGLFQVTNSMEIPAANEKVHVNITDEVLPVVRFNPPIQRLEKRTEFMVKDPSGRSKKIDYLKKAKENAYTGSTGEQVIVEQEKRYLVSEGRADLAQKVKRVSIDDDTVGYDIISYDKNGHEKFIEVKTTTVKSDTIRFFLSANELRFAQNHPAFFIYYVENIHSKNPRISIFPNPVDNYLFTVEPDTYVVTAKKAK